MTSTKIIRTRTIKALNNATRRAECNISFGFGTAKEAIGEWEWFVDAFPSLAPHVTKSAWCEAYMSMKGWVAVRAASKRDLITGEPNPRRAPTPVTL